MKTICGGVFVDPVAFNAKVKSAFPRHRAMPRGRLVAPVHLADAANVTQRATSPQRFYVRTALFTAVAGP